MSCLIPKKWWTRDFITVVLTAAPPGPCGCPQRALPRRWAIGNVTEKSLADIWNAPEHIEFRERVQAFDFAPCITCSGCELSENNEEDCFGNTFPTCGGCLWAE